MFSTKKILGTIVILFSFFYAQAQEVAGYNTNSVRPVHEYDQFYKKTLWFRINGREKQNRGFFASNNEITKIIIEAVKAGVIRPFYNDSLKDRMPFEEFKQRLSIPGVVGEGEDMSVFNNGDWDSEEHSTVPAPKPIPEYFPKDLYLLEMKEHMIFDKRKSRMMHDIQAITIKIPSELDRGGLEKSLGTFSYKELIENVFKGNPDAVWYNTENESENRNLADAFDLRLFSGMLIKYGNERDAAIVDLYGEGRAAVIASQQMLYQIIDYEQDLWEN
ncbi:MAG: gliding motility protein GldN [Bacteroidetes bacterium]|nr:MAG: gliding motility protein GldN [Bacteroidota bacterium]